MSVKKRIVSVIVTAAVIVGASAGITTAVRVTTQNNRVMVVPVSDLNTGGYFYGGGGSMSGQVTTDASQNVYVSDTETVESVSVREGQSVKEGDVLLTFDTRKTSLGLQQEQLNHQKIELDIEVAKKNIETLNKLKPVSDSDGGGGDIVPVIPDDNDGNKEKTGTVYVGTITSTAVDQYTGDGDGTADNPYIFLVRADDDGNMTIDPSFISALRTNAGQAAAGETGDGSGQTSGETASGGTPDGDADTQVTDSPDVYFCLKNVDESGTLVSAWIGSAASMSTEKETKLNMSGGGISASGLTVDEIAAVLSAMQLTDEEKAAIKKAAGIAESVVTVTPTPTPAPTGEPVTTPEPTAEPTQAPSDNGGNGSGTGNNSGITEGTTTASHQLVTVTPPAAQTAMIRRIVKAGDGRSSGRLISGSLPGGSMTSSAMYIDASAVYSSMTGTAGAEAVLTAETSSPSADNSGGSSGSDDSSGYSGLIPSNAEYTAEDLKQAKKDEQEKLDSLELDLKESDLKIAQTQKDLNEGTVRAKMNGVVKKAGDPENIPKDGSAFITVTGSEGMYIQSAVAESMLNSVHEGDTVTVTSWTTGNTYEGTIKEISPYPDTSGMYGYSTEDSYYPFTAYINTPDAQLTEGDSLDVSIDSASTDGMTDDGSLYLSKAFIREENGTKYVWKRGDDGKLTKQSVKTGKLSNDSYQILSGLSSDDWVAFPYGNDVREGAVTREGTVNDLYSS